LPALIRALQRRTRETVSEMRKVLWPSRKEMITYTIVVTVFVVILVALVALLDLGLTKAVLAVFG
jgi:preprotein translocase subunit SecE